MLVPVHSIADGRPSTMDGLESHALLYAYASLAAATQASFQLSVEKPARRAELSHVQYTLRNLVPFA